MNVTELVLTDEEQRLLASVRGSQWENVSGEMFDRPDFAWESVRIETTSGSIQVKLLRELVDLYGDVDDYPVLHVEHAGPISPLAEGTGSIFYQGRGEVIEAAWVIRDTIVGIREGEVDLRYVADVAVIFQLANCWIALARTSHITNAFHIRRSATRDGIELPNTSQEWPSDLLDQYTVTREWIPIGG